MSARLSDSEPTDSGPLVLLRGGSRKLLNNNVFGGPARI